MSRNIQIIMKAYNGKEVLIGGFHDGRNADMVKLTPQEILNGKNHINKMITDSKWINFKYIEVTLNISGSVSNISKPGSITLKSKVQCKSTLRNMLDTYFSIINNTEV